MRAFLILLLLANLGYLAWWQGWFTPGAKAPAAQQRGFEPATQSLVLLQELPAARRELMSSLAQSRNARTTAQQELANLQQEMSTVEAEIGEVQEELAQDQARSAEVQQALLDTLDAAVAEASVDAVPPEPWCAMAGAFADQRVALEFIEGARELGVEAQFETRQEPIGSTWWVHMPAFESEAAARERLQELQARNIDSYYMRTGEMAGGISLGVYSREESALIAQQQLADRGYATSIRQVMRMGDRFYVALAMPDQALREQPEWTAFLASARGLELTENACETIASENEFP